MIILNEISDISFEFSFIRIERNDETKCTTNSKGL